MRTTIVESRTFSDAAVMVEACYTELVRGGFSKEANSLRGVEIFSASGARTALSTLRCLKPTGNEDVDNAIRYAMATLEAVTPSTQAFAHVS